ncbi:MAG: hypothetical protein EYC62_00215 [Alphaproteobacteria bacterium]|nr:MAG: hypothetical protein EYC62_00215 [Alphaproteobacteria bacterium]
MRIQDMLSAIRAPRRRKTVRASHKSMLTHDNDNRRGDSVEILPPEQPAFGAANDMPWVLHSSEYVTQFIHQELLPDGRVIGQARQAAEKYQQANQNLQTRPQFAKISV